MTIAHTLSDLHPTAFENLVNALALRTLGNGLSGFGPGADGGRDGYFSGSANYPSEVERWDGIWYIQSKFFSAGTNKNEHQWLLERIKAEIAAFQEDGGDRIWPDNWVIATNIEPGGKPQTGSFDAIRELVDATPNGKNVKLAVWGGRKILDLLIAHPDIAHHYGHFLTPGNVISKLYAELGALSEQRPTIEEVVRYFVVGQFGENLYTKLEQAGSSSDIRPRVHDLFIDLPYHGSRISRTDQPDCLILETLCLASAQSHRHKFRRTVPESWREWSKQPKRARVTVIKGGPGQGKSTIGQYLCQIHRAALILSEDGPAVLDSTKDLAQRVQDVAAPAGFWPGSPRIPVQIELKEYAHWHSQSSNDKSRSVLTYLAAIVTRKTGLEVSAGTLRSALSKQSWLVVFDGLDEVPNDHKDEVSKEVVHFINDLVVEIDADVLAVCTSRPQGYSGQFSSLDGAEVALARLDPTAALRCALPLLKFGRGDDDAEKSIQTLETAIKSPNIQELMTTPLQAHIMAIVVRDGGKPPERRWRLFQSFYQVMKRRESLKGFKNPKIAELLQGEDRLLKAVHMRLGFVLHARAERSSGAQTVLSKAEFRDLVRYVVIDLGSDNVEETVDVLMEATTERLVLVSTPDNGDQVRFDIRQLQEFFAAEFLYDGVAPRDLAERIEMIGTDAHWREVMHFLLSALIADRRTTELAVAVQELLKMNVGSDSTDESLFHRRTAHATLMAIRLLLEGVVEDDQKDRRNLKSLISDLGGISDFHTLAGLLYLSQRNSKQWLIGVLLERVKVSMPSEHVGALFVLGGLLPDDHPETALVQTAFDRLPVTMRAVLIANWCTQRSLRSRYELRGLPSSAHLSLWVLSRVVRILNTNEWLEYSPVAVTRMFTLVQSYPALFADACSLAGIGLETARSIHDVILAGDEMMFGRKSETKPIACGALAAFHFPENWTNGKVPAEFVDVDPRLHITALGGAFRLALSILCFAKLKNKASLLEFLRLAEISGRSHLATLPKILLALVPLRGEHELEPYSFSHLRSFDAKTNVSVALASLRQELDAPYFTYRLAGKENTDWALLSLKLPTFALRILFEPADSPLYTGIDTIVPELRNLIRSDFSNLVEYFPRWGSLQSLEPALLDEIRAGVCRLPIESLDPDIELEPRLVPFKLSLPSEGNLLPILAITLLEWRDSPREVAVQPALPALAYSAFEVLLADFGIVPDALRNISRSTEVALPVRAGALSIYWMYAAEVGIELDLVEEWTLYDEVLNTTSKNWLTRALVECLLMPKQQTDHLVVETVTKLLAKNEDGTFQLEISPLLTAWRERSNAPITSTGVLAKWLGYHDHTPAYAK